MLKIESEISATELLDRNATLSSPKLAMSEPAVTVSTTMAVRMPAGRARRLSRSSEMPSGALVSMMPKRNSTTMAPM